MPLYNVEDVKKDLAQQMYDKCELSLLDPCSIQIAHCACHIKKLDADNLDPSLYTLNISDHLQIHDFILTKDKRGFFMYDVLLWPRVELEDTVEENATGC